MFKSKPIITIALQNSKLCLCLALLLTSGLCYAELSDSLTEVDASDSPGFSDVQWIDQEFSDKQLHGKVVLVNFWATWCPPCVEELPSIRNLRNSLDRKDFEVVAVNAGENRQDIETFLQQWGLSDQFAVAIDIDLKVYSQWNVRPLPTTFLIDRRGRFRYQAIGGRNFESANIRDVVQRLIDEQ